MKNERILGALLQVEPFSIAREVAIFEALEKERRRAKKRIEKLTQELKDAKKRIAELEKYNGG